MMAPSYEAPGSYHPLNVGSASFLKKFWDESIIAHYTALRVNKLS